MIKIRFIKKHSATAIISVILIVALVSITAITMQGYLRGEINRTQILVEGDELYNNLLTIESWGLATLKTFNKTSDNRQLKLNAVQGQTKLEAEIINQNGLFNLNYLNNVNYCRQGKLEDKHSVLNKIFSNLLVLVNKQNLQPVTLDQAVNITNEVQTWMCSFNKASYKNQDQNQDQSNNESKEKLKWSYQHGKQLFYDISELKLVPGITSEIYNNLKNFITALPTVVNNNNNLFNLESISPELLAAIANTDVQAAKNLLDTNKNAVNTQKVVLAINFISSQNKYDTKELNFIKTFLTPDNQQDTYYIIKSLATNKDFTMMLQTLIVSAKDVKIIWRKRGL